MSSVSYMFYTSSIFSVSSMSSVSSVSSVSSDSSVSSVSSVSYMFSFTPTLKLPPDQSSSLKNPQWPLEIKEKAHGPHRRSGYRFWNLQDFVKFESILDAAREPAHG